MKRVVYIDNLRIVLIILVILHHLAIIYGGPGLWAYHGGACRYVDDPYLLSNQCQGHDIS